MIGLVLEPPVYGMVERDGIQIHFMKIDKGPIPLMRHTNPFCNDFIIWVPDIDVFFNELEKNRVIIKQTIHLKPYGNREFIFEDCDGRYILVAD